MSLAPGRRGTRGFALGVAFGCVLGWDFGGGFGSGGGGTGSDLGSGSCGGGAFGSTFGAADSAFGSVFGSGGAGSTFGCGFGSGGGVTTTTCCGIFASGFPPDNAQNEANAATPASATPAATPTIHVGRGRSAGTAGLMAGRASDVNSVLRRVSTVIGAVLRVAAPLTAAVTAWANAAHVGYRSCGFLASAFRTAAEIGRAHV